MNKTLKLPPVTSYQAAKYCALVACFLFLNFSTPQREPFAFPLYYASLACGFHPVAAGLGYLLAAIVPLSPVAFFSALTQVALFTLLSVLYRPKGGKFGWEKLIYLAVAQVPFALLFPLEAYALPISLVWQKVILSALFVILGLIFEKGLNSLMHRAFQCKLSAGQFFEIALIWAFVGTGMCNALGEHLFYAISLSLLLLCAVTLKNASAVTFALTLSLPLCIARASAAPVAEFAAYACFALLLCPYGSFASSLAMALSFLCAQFFRGSFAVPTREIVFLLLSCVTPVLVVCLMPEKLFAKIKSTLLFYRERALPRIAINRNRRAVGERLYEVSSLFREIEGAFSDNFDQPDSTAFLAEQLKDTFCNDCPSRQKCERSGAFESLEKMVAVGRVKGQVSLVDLTAELSSRCGNSAGLLFACNKLLAGYRNNMREIETARESRKLLAEQARGVSEILKDIALEQSEQYCFSDGEAALSGALSAAGILNSEIFVYGEGNSLTVSMTLLPNVNGKKLCSVAGSALGVPLSLSEKIPLSPTRTCYVLKRKPEYDAAFGVAFQKKEGEEASGDTYSVLKIDERKFLVALSDGMGSGENARAVSDKTLSLLESFYKAKMPSETVLNTVNRLISYSSDEMFSCLDLAAVDLDTGEADIVKIGSPVGFILSDEELKVLEGESLPIGMLDCVHPATLRAQVGENDFILFMSDGVTSAFSSSADLFSYLSELRPMNPQSLAEEVLGKALSFRGGKADDDMTVLAVKLLKTA